MAVGMWIGTLPVGMLAKAYGRRFALQIGSACGALAGIISSAAMLRGSFALLLIRHLLRRPLRGGAPILSVCGGRHCKHEFRAKAVAWVLAGDMFAAVIGPQLVILTKEFGPPICSRALF